MDSWHIDHQKRQKGQVQYHDLEINRDIAADPDFLNYDRPHQGLKNDRIPALVYREKKIIIL
jgi:hypothetical protein